MSKQITKIVLTGGPCAGKTTGMSYLSQKLSDLGYGVIIVPELATELINAGLSPNKNIPSYDFQLNILLGQLNKESLYLNLGKALQKEKVVILFDRGTMDIKAYIDENSWFSILEELNLNQVKLRDERYDAVIHLRTAALIDSDIYSNDNNKARYENKEEAIQSDSKILSSWIGHPHLRIIDNRDDFSSKIHRVLAEVLHILGEPIPLEIEHKYLVSKSFDWKNLPVSYQEIDIEQAYLSIGGRIRKRGQSGVFIYTETHKEETDDELIRVEVEKRITSKEYYEKLKQKIVGSRTIIKKRICFVYKEQYFELDFFINFEHAPFLEIELTNRNANIDLPPFIPIVRDVTYEKNFSNRALALS